MSFRVTIWGMTTFSGRLRRAREAAGLTQQDVVFEIRQALPAPMRISQTKLQRLESGAIDEDKADAFLLLFLASIYGVDLADLSEPRAEDVKTGRRGGPLVLDTAVHIVW